MVQRIKKEIIQPIKGFISLMERNIHVENFNMPVASITLLWAFGGLYMMDKFNLNNYIYGIVYYLILILLCVINWRSLKSFFVNPVRTPIKGWYKNRKFELFFLFPVLVLCFSGFITNLIYKTNVVPVDPQGLTQMHIGLDILFLEYLYMPLGVVAEEFFNLVVLAFMFKGLSNVKRVRLPLSIIIASSIFGMLHIFSWNIDTVLCFGASHIPYFILLLYSKNIWLSVIAHLLQNTLGIATMYDEDLGFLLVSILKLIVIVYYIKSTAKDMFFFFFGLFKRNNTEQPKG